MVIPEEHQSIQDDKTEDLSWTNCEEGSHTTQNLQANLRGGQEFDCDLVYELISQ